MSEIVEVETIRMWTAEELPGHRDLLGAPLPRHAGQVRGSGIIGGLLGLPGKDKELAKDEQ